MASCRPATPAGYIGSLSLLESIAAVCARLKEATPNLTYGK